MQAVKAVGFETQDAIHTVDRLIVANLSLSKAEGLAKVAKDAAAIENIAAPEALEIRRKQAENDRFFADRAVAAAAVAATGPSRLKIEKWMALISPSAPPILPTREC